MSDSSPVISLTILLVAALVGGVVAHRLRQPVILGYLLIGVAVGPNALGLVSDFETVEMTATIGVALLMLTLGLEFSIGQLRQMGKIGIWGGLAQIFATSALGFGAGLVLFHWPWPQSLLFGLVIYNSSTAVCLKLLMERAELDSAHGRIMIAMLILQDVLVVVMMGIIPLLSESATNLLLDFVFAIIKAVLFVGVAVILGLWVVPWLLGRVGGVRSRELFLLTVLTLCLGAAIGTYFFGLPVVLGSFVIGIALRESQFAHEALAEVTPLRDIFAALFFVSLGMFLDPAFVLQHWWLVIATVLLVTFFKFAVIYAITRLFGYSGRVALLSGAGLIQVGEFGFILTQAGVTGGIVTDDFRALILASAIISMLLTPLSISLAAKLYPRYMLGPSGTRLGTVFNDSTTSPSNSLAVNPIIIAGYGRIGRNIVRALHQNGFTCTVIEIDPELVIKLRQLEVITIYGDASNTHILSQASVEQASILIVTYPDPLAVVSTIKNSLQLNPKLKVLARLNRSADAKAFSGMDCVEFISPEYEASMSFITRTLSTMGWQHEAIDLTTRELRQQLSKPTTLSQDI
ncbi:MAG: cation:proton antiporter [Chloroflexota bacterium]